MLNDFENFQKNFSFSKIYHQHKITRNKKKKTFKFTRNISQKLNQYKRNSDLKQKVAHKRTMSGNQAKVETEKDEEASLINFLDSLL